VVVFDRKNVDDLLVGAFAIVCGLAQLDFGAAIFVLAAVL